MLERAHSARGLGFRHGLGRKAEGPDNDPLQRILQHERAPNMGQNMPNSRNLHQNSKLSRNNVYKSGFFKAEKIELVGNCYNLNLNRDVEIKQNWIF